MTKGKRLAPRPARTDTHPGLSRCSRDEGRGWERRKLRAGAPWPPRSRPGSAAPFLSSRAAARQRTTRPGCRREGEFTWTRGPSDLRAEKQHDEQRSGSVRPGGMTVSEADSWLQGPGTPGLRGPWPLLHPASICPEEAARCKQHRGPSRSVCPGSRGGGPTGRPAPSQQLLLVVFRARGALAHLLVPLVGEGFHLDTSVVEVLLS